MNIILLRPTLEQMFPVILIGSEMAQRYAEGIAYLVDKRVSFHFLASNIMTHIT